MKLTLYRMATTLGGPLISYYLKKRLLTSKEDEERFPERLGIASLPRPAGKVMWIHAASIGESLSVLPLIDRLRTDYPHWQILVTTGTVTSARLMVERLPKGARHQFVPVDRVSYVRRFLEHWKPDLALWMESEFWPNLVIETRACATPMVVLNGRMSDLSFGKWNRHKSMIRRILSSFRLVLAQSETDAERFTKLGAKAVDYPGNLKFSCDPLPADDIELEELLQHIGERPLWLASSTHLGEELMCGKVHQHLKAKIPDLLTIIVPRHASRGKDVCQQLSDLGLNVARRSKNQQIVAETDVYVADTMGELGLFYRLCSVVFMGKTFAVGGGQNPIEPAQLQCALIFGPDVSNFRAIAEKLIQDGAALSVTDQDQFLDAVQTLLNDPSNRIKMMETAHQIAISETHVIDRILDHLTPFLTTTESSHHARP